MIKLTSDIYKITKIKKKTNAKGFKDFKVGDLIQFNTEIKDKSRASGNGVYATYIETNNLTQNISILKSQSQLANILSRNFEIEKSNI